MKVIGEGSIHIFNSEDEGPHRPPKDEPLWQESFVLYTWDTEQQVYTFFRLGHEPNRGAGFSVAWINIWTPEYMFKYTEDSLPLKEEDRTDTTASASNVCFYAFDGNHHWTVNAGEVNARLIMTDDHPGIGYFPKLAGSLVTETAKNHIEGSGTVKGKITIKDKEYLVNGIGCRDHTWGNRRWEGIRVHRGFWAFFGKEFKFFNLTFIGADGKLSKSGGLVEGSNVRFIDDFEILAYVAEDGVSNRGGIVKLRLDNKLHELMFHPVGKSTISFHRGFACVDTMNKVMMGDKVGVGLTETSHNAQGGLERPSVYPSSPGVMDNGLFRI